MICSQFVFRTGTFGCFFTGNVNNDTIKFNITLSNTFIENLALEENEIMTISVRNYSEIAVFNITAESTNPKFRITQQTNSKIKCF